ncbi:MAG: dienelactone hydrolase family protein [Lentisphaeria bacterium]|nr:dienelactone hydrolase family protein [Lentisphaeria bacterium]
MKRGLIFLAVVLSLLAGAAEMEKVPVFNDHAAKYWDFEKLKNPPAFVDDNDPACAVPSLRAIVYDGVVEDGKVTKFFAYIAIPEGEMPAGGWPGIVLAHGGGGTAFPWAVKEWCAAGYAVIAPDWCGRRPNKADFVGQYNKTPRRNASYQRKRLYDSFTNPANLVLAHSILLSLPEVNKDKTAYVGLSWGSWYGAIVTAIDPRFKGMIAIYLGDRKKYAAKNMIDGRFLHEAKVPMYYVVGTNDAHGSPETLQSGFDACGKMLGNKTMIVRLPHDHYGFRFKACYRYAAEILKGEAGLPKLAKPVISGKNISSEVLSPGRGICKVYLCYTADKDIKESKKRHWEMIPAEYDGRKVSAVLPDNVYQCYLAAYDEEDLTSFCCGTSDVITFESAPDGHQLKKD